MENEMQYSQYSINGAYVVKCSYCGKEYETRSRSVGSGYQTAICEVCRPIVKHEYEVERWRQSHPPKEAQMITLPQRRDLSDGEFMEKIGHLINAMINEAGSCVQHGTSKERAAAIYFLKEGGVDDWVHFAGIEVSLPLRRMINEAADGYYKEEAI